MASVHEVIASFDLFKIKGRRATCQRMLSILKKQLEMKLVKTGTDPDAFDHAKIPRDEVLDDVTKVRKYQKDFEELHYAWLSYRPEDEDEEEEKKLSEKDDNYYVEVTNVAQELLMSDQYEESYQYEGRLRLMFSARLKYIADQEGHDDLAGQAAQGCLLQAFPHRPQGDGECLH